MMPSLRHPHRQVFLCVSCFTVLADVETFCLLFRVDAQAHRGTKDFQHNKTYDKGVKSNKCNGSRLDEELLHVIVESAIGTGCINCHGGEQARHECTQCTANTMDSEGVQRVVIAELRLGIQCDVAYQPGGNAY